MVQVRYFLICLFVLAIIGFASASDLSDTRYSANKNIELNFRCTLNGEIPSPATTYNFSIEYPNGSLFLNNVEASPKGNGLFNYTTHFYDIGVYRVHQFCYDGVYSYSNTEPIDITTGGDSSNITMTAVIVLLVFSFSLFILALLTENEYVGFISGLLFSVTGVFVMIYGFGNLANIYTQAIAYVSLGWGLILVLVAGWKALADITGESVEL